MNTVSDSTTHNRLATSQSAYLKSAAHQPVQWHPWSEEAFAEARRLDRPILLDIGAVWCHWCHVMDGESYENAEIAKLINEKFIAIKVDRDERPDVDRRYQEAVGAITGQGGWPLTAFLTPDGHVFFGGTYFPPADKFGRPGFPQVLTRVADYFQNKRDSALESASGLAAVLNERADRTQPGDISVDLVRQLARKILESHDGINGGFGSAPKFPHPTAIEFLIARHYFQPDGSTEQVIRRTLRKMGRGGVYDQLAGGFHRYSTDERWIVPHFEKMLYDNTELLRVYAAGSALLGDAEMAEVARGIVRFFTETLSDGANGGFHASQDADVGLHDDGDYFTWSLAEVQAVCAPAEAAILAERYDIRTTGEMHHDAERNVLFVATDWDVIAAKLQKLDDEVRARAAAGEQKLREVRAQRLIPYIDRALYAGWNGMAISACLIAADLLDEPEAEALAMRALDRIINDCLRPDGQVRHASGLETPVGLLEDGVFLARACLDAYERTGREVDLANARLIADDLVARLWDKTTGGFFDHAPDADAIGLLAQPRKPLQDAPTPSPNAVAAELLFRLSELTGETKYRDQSEATLRAFAGTAGPLGIFGGSYALALDRFLNGGSMAVVVGAPGDKTAAALERKARRSFRPYKTVRRLSPDQTQSAAGLPAELKAMITSGASMGYFCAGNACALPTNDPTQYAMTIATFARKP